MKKYLLLLSPFLLIVVVFFGFFLAGSFKPSPSSSTTLKTQPTPTSVPLNSIIQHNMAFSLIDTSPKNLANNTSITTPIIFTFNKQVASTNFTFSSIPNISFTTNILGNRVTLTPTQPLSEGTTYYFFAQSNTTPDALSFSFTTVSSQPTILPTITGSYTGPGEDNTPELMDQLALKEAPDIYLYNRCPYKGNDFSVTSDFTNSDGSHYYFVVTLIGNDASVAKNDFTQWALSLGFTSSQLQTLDIRYQ